MRMTIPALIIGAVLAAPALAKLPPPSDEAKAAEAAAKAGWAGKVGDYQLCRAMDRTAEFYRKSERAAGKQPPAPVETPACADPGPFVATPPLEASGAHSPATTATGAPGSKATAAELQGQAKK